MNKSKLTSLASLLYRILHMSNAGDAAVKASERSLRSLVLSGFLESFDFTISLKWRIKSEYGRITSSILHMRNAYDAAVRNLWKKPLV